MAGISYYISVDLGAESGRVMLGAVSCEGIGLEEVYRFSNGPVEENGTLRWDFAGLFAEIKVGIARAIRQCDGEIAGIAVDSWGVDFGLIDEDGVLLEKPYHYRDGRTNGMMEKAFELMSKREIYEKTGLQFLQFNTVYQLLSMRLAGSEVLRRADKLIFMADLVSYYLSGEVFAEYTLGSTSQLMDMATGKWSKAVFDALFLPKGIMPKIVQPGSIVGSLQVELAEEFGCKAIPVIAVASHDTNSAVAAVPASGGEWAFISSGTWSLMGMETPSAIISDASFRYDFTNEGGIAGTINFLKNIMGLWLVQECRRQWQRDGVELSYAEMTAMADGAEAFSACIDPDYGEFLAPGDMPGKINRYLAGSGQKELEDKGAIIRTILESLAFKYRQIAERLEDVSGSKIEILHIVGGGIKNELLCQFAANATGKKVVAGPVEATAIGSVVTQAMATGQIKTLEQGRALVRSSFDVKEYSPQDSSVWSEQYEKVKRLQEAK